MIRSVILVATLLAAANCAERDQFVAMGNIAVHYMPNTAISTDDEPLTAIATGPIWCQITRNDEVIPIATSTFFKYNDAKRRMHHPEINHTTNKASLELDQIVAHGMGKYRCDITINDTESTQRTIYGNLLAYSRPFFHSNGSIKMTPEEHNPFVVIGGVQYATVGSPLVLQCPAVGFPKPTILWYKDTEVLEASDNVRFNGTNLQIENFSDEDAGVYRCTATNELPTRLDENIVQFEASLEQTVQIGSAYGWVYPLLVILVTLFLLFIIIYACAACKRYQHDNYNVAKREKLLRHQELRTPSPGSSSASTKKYELVSDA
ncbi:hypothetical protein PFISCL1PPCAC_2740 [Pristionchus fissidentatus]|uniref:Ig-like domain-containing protein n=1 Tax=Pristionchus fissidentatus TaxID=1538716 RepID=A0AAV5UZ48_9BILA|nr:hypothetical protein PFISCL1PPCAC_2740 [Pristionchus fissidentatus]